MSEPVVSFPLDMDEVVDLSNALIDLMEEDAIPVSMGAASAALTLGRLIHDQKMSFDDGARFINQVIQFTKEFFKEETIH
jgi:hypothetical protein